MPASYLRVFKKVSRPFQKWLALQRCSEGALLLQQTVQKYPNLDFSITQEHNSIGWMLFPKTRNRYLNLKQLKRNHYRDTTEVVHYVRPPSGVCSHLTEVSPVWGCEFPGEKTTETESTGLTHPHLHCSSTGASCPPQTFKWLLQPELHGTQVGCKLDPGWSPATTHTQVQELC